MSPLNISPDMKEHRHIGYKEDDLAPPLHDYGMSGLVLNFQANPQHLVAALGAIAGSKRKSGPARV